MKMPAAAIAGIVAIATAPASAQSKTAHPPMSRDFGGVWTYATMTPLERPREFGTKETLSREDAAAYERQTIDGAFL